MDNVRARVKEIIAECSGVDPAMLDDDISLGDIGTDACVLVKLLKALESEFRTKITANGAEKLPTIGAIIHCISQKK